MLAAALVSLLGTAAPQNAPQTAPPAWNLAPNGTLVWEGQPYVPIGARVSASASDWKPILDAGIKDLLVEVPATGTTLAETVKALEESGARFFLEVNSMAPSSVGFSVEPESYRRTGVVGPTTVEGTIPGAREVLLLLVAMDGNVLETRKVPTDATGKFSEAFDPKNSLEHVVLAYPILEEARLPDAWERADLHRDQLLAATAGPRPQGLRGWVDVAGRVPRFPNADLNFVPTSPRFHMELETHLRAKYGQLRRAEQSWGVLASDLQQMSDLARLVPLWSARRGVSAFWDPKQKRIYQAQNRNSTAWTDIQTVVQSAWRRRYATLAQTMQRRWGAPVISTWSGWNGPYEGNAAQLAGVGVKLAGERLTDLIDAASRAASTVSRWENRGVMIATQVALPAGEENRAQLSRLLGDSQSMGFRGWFFDVFAEADRTWIAQQSAALDRPALLSSTTRTIPFPEAALNPAIPMELRPNLWWVPSPQQGNRVDFGRRISGYRIRLGEQDATVLWANQEPVRVRLRAVNPRALLLQSPTGEALESRVTRTHLEFTLTTTPVVVAGPEMAVPQESIDETLDEFAQLASTVPPRIQNVLDDIEAFRMIATTLNQAPGEAYLGMRVRLERLRRSISPHVWLEAELSRDHNWSDIATVPGASNNSVLSLSTRLVPAEGVFRARYNIVPRFTGVHELWIATSGSPEAFRGLSASFGETQLTGQAEGPFSHFGPGIGWIKLGEAQLSAPAVLEFRLPAPLVAPVALDVILITPAGYRPRGATLNWIPTPLPPAR